MMRQPCFCFMHFFHRCSIRPGRWAWPSGRGPYCNVKEFIMNVTSYTASQPGTHVIVWLLYIIEPSCMENLCGSRSAGKLASNVELGLRKSREKRPPLQRVKGRLFGPPGVGPYTN